MLKKTLIFLVLIFSIKAVGAFASESDSLIRVANKHYADNEYNSAAMIYQSLIDEGYKSFGIYYNLGNAYYRMNNYARAILNYERALQLNPSDNDIQFNLELAKAHIVDEIDVIPQFFLKRWLSTLTNKFGPNIWAYVSIVSFVLFLLLFLIYLFSGKILLKQIAFYLSLLLFVISISGYYFSAQSKKILSQHNHAIILSASVTVKSSPNDYGTNLFILHEGTKIELLDSIGQWNEIRISNGNKGWIPNDAFERI